MLLFDPFHRWGNWGVERLSNFSRIWRPLTFKTILLFCISLPWGWSWSLSPVQCHEPHSIVHQAQYFGHLMRRVDSLEKTLMLGGIGARGEGDNRGWDGWMASLTRWMWVWVNSRSWWWTGRPGVLRFMGSQRVGHDWVTDLIWSDPTTYTLNWLKRKNYIHISFQNFEMRWCSIIGVSLLCGTFI